MPAIRPAVPSALPVLVPVAGAARPVVEVVTAARTYEGGGFPVRRPIPGPDATATDPFLLLDHMGPIDYAPGEAKGAPEHPHRGFETVTYVLDGAMEHRDSTGGGGVIGEGETQWMTAGAGLVHSEMPLESMLRDGGRMHGVQLWVNLPRREKMTPPRYQHLTRDRIILLRGTDERVVVRLIAGQLGGYRGPGDTRTPITYGHATLAPGSGLDAPWDPGHNALVYVLSGRGGVDGSAVEEGQLAVLGAGDRIVVEASDGDDELDVLLLGGRPLREPVAWYGPFVMNTKAEIVQAVDDFQAGRMGRLAPGSA